MPFRLHTVHCIVWIFVALVTLVVSPQAALADFETGRRAYEHENYQEALRAWLPLAEAGDAEAQFRVGTLYSGGKGVKQDFDVAHSYYIRAALQGHPRAQFEAGARLLLMEEAPEEQALGLALLLRAATAGETLAYVDIASAYCFGRGIEENHVLADIWMVLALGPLSKFESFMHCDVMTPLTREYHAEILRRAEGLSLAYGFTPYGSEPSR